MNPLAIIGLVIFGIYIVSQYQESGYHRAEAEKYRQEALRHTLRAMSYQIDAGTKFTKLALLNAAQKARALGEIALASKFEKTAMTAN